MRVPPEVAERLIRSQAEAYTQWVNTPTVGPHPVSVESAESKKIREQVKQSSLPDVTHLQTQRPGGYRR